MVGNWKANDILFNVIPRRTAVPIESLFISHDKILSTFQKDRPGRPHSPNENETIINYAMLFNSVLEMYALFRGESFSSIKQIFIVIW